MTRRSLGIASAVVVATLLAVAFAVGSGLDPAVRLPVHWGIDGEADRFAGRWEALLMPAAIAAGVSLLFWFLPALEPRRKGLERSQGLYLWGWATLLLMSVVIEFVVISEAIGWGIPANRLVIGAVGGMLLLIGNQLGKSRSMYMVGIRTPWTLASEEVWIKTHRLGGKLMVAAGLAMISAALLPLPSGLLAAVMGAAIAVSVLVPIVYSFLLWRAEKKAQPSE